MTSKCPTRSTETTSGLGTFVTKKCDKQSDLKPSQLRLPLEHQGKEDDRSERIVPITVRIPDAIRMTGLGRSKIYELIASGDIETVKIGRCTLIPVESLHRLIENGRR